METFNNCRFCGTPIQCRQHERPCDVRKKVFCNQSCSAKMSNRSPKRPHSEVVKPCTDCGKIIASTPGGRCANCWFRFQHETAGNLLKREVSRERISAHARRVIKDSLSACLVCGYDFAVEAAHIKPVKSFSADTPVKEMNLLENLIPLCPNHHLEFDRGKLKLEDIPRGRERQRTSLLNCGVSV